MKKYCKSLFMLLGLVASPVLSAATFVPINVGDITVIIPIEIAEQVTEPSPPPAPAEPEETAGTPLVPIKMGDITIFIPLPDPNALSISGNWYLGSQAVSSAIVGQDLNFTWNSNNATGCVVAGVGGNTMSGSGVFGTLAAEYFELGQKQVTVTCTGTDGSSDSKTFNVTINGLQPVLLRKRDE